jgi:hypothetical protein
MWALRGGDERGPVCSGLLLTYMGGGEEEERRTVAAAAARPKVHTPPALPRTAIPYQPSAAAGRPQQPGLGVQVLGELVGEVAEPVQEPTEQASLSS